VHDSPVAGSAFWTGYGFFFSRLSLSAGGIDSSLLWADLLGPKRLLPFFLRLSFRGSGLGRWFLLCPLVPAASPSFSPRLVISPVMVDWRFFPDRRELSSCPPGWFFFLPSLQNRAADIGLLAVRLGPTDLSPLSVPGDSKEKSFFFRRLRFFSLRGRTGLSPLFLDNMPFLFPPLSVVSPFDVLLDTSAGSLFSHDAGRPRRPPFFPFSGCTRVFFFFGTCLSLYVGGEVLFDDRSLSPFEPPFLQSPGVHRLPPSFHWDVPFPSFVTRSDIPPNWSTESLRLPFFF